MPVVTSNGMSLAYDEFGDAANPPIVLIMGLGTQMIAWSEPFCEALAARGFRVIRFDNRDIGLSTKLDKAPAVSVGAAIFKAWMGKPVEAPYTLDDMAADAVGLFDALGLDKVHVVGASMGGMIAQIVAARYPQRVLSLTSIMSSSGRPDLPQAKPRVTLAMLGARPKEGDRKGAIAQGMKVYRAIGSRGFPAGEAELRQLIARFYDRSYYPAGVARQLMAIIASGSRVDLLPTIKAPTLVLHGEDDPLVPIDAGRDMAALIPGAVLKTIPGWGHDLPPAIQPILVAAIANHCHSHDA